MALLSALSSISLQLLMLKFMISKSKKIWEEMIISKGTESGKIKVVIADASFFAYDNVFTLITKLKNTRIVK